MAQAGSLAVITFKIKVELDKNGVVTNAFNWIDTSTFLQLDVGDNC